MPQRDPERYTLGDDGQIVERVGSWANEKIRLLTDYVYVTGGARKNFLRTGSAYIEPFCGPGRSIIRNTDTYIDGSCVAAFRRSIQSSSPFTSIDIADADNDLLAAATQRLTELDAPVRSYDGYASDTLPQIVNNIDSYGLHVAFLDPHNLGALTFDLFVELAKLKRIDVIAHVSVSDLRRNASRYANEDFDQFDKFAPGWRAAVSTDMTAIAFRAAILEYWSKKVEALGLPQAKRRELIRGNQGQHLYWLILLSRHDLAHALWNKVSSAAISPTFDF